MARPRRPSEYDVLADGTIRIHLTGGLFALIDPEDIDLTERCWGVGTNGYATHSSYLDRPRTARMHRLVMSRALERELMSAETVDHIDGNPLDNRRRNLRLVTIVQNSYNRAVQKSSRHGFKGVSTISARESRKRPYRAVMYHDHQKLSIATCETPEEAAWWYDQWALELHGEYARLNLEYV